MTSQTMPIPGPLSIGDIIDRAFRIYRARFKPMIQTALLLLVPFAVISGVLSYFVNAQALAAAEDIDAVGSLASVMGSLMLALFGWLVQGLAELALTFQAQAALRDDVLEPRVALSAAGARIVSWLGMSLLRGLAFVGLILITVAPTLLLSLVGGESAAAAFGALCMLGLAMLAVVALAVILQTRWVVATPALVIEELGATASLGRSWELTRGKFWRSFAVLLVLFIISFLVLSLPSMVISWIALFAATDTALWSAIGSAFGTILTAFFAPLTAATYLVLYYDLRVRRENLDLDMRVQQLEAESRPAEGPEA
jgi:hypothetical protein